MLKIKDLKAGIENKTILHKINLEINSGEFHVIMGRNGTGKSTLANVLAGKENYNILNGDIIYNNKSIKNDLPEERAAKGIFMSFQYPVSIPGVNCMHFLRSAVNSIRKHKGKDELEASEFIKQFKECLKIVGLKEDFTKRVVNEGFSGGEKKRFEILQMLMLEPKLIILDETDSGLDIDALKIVADGVNTLRDKNNSFLIITHYQRLLDYIKPDFVHVLSDGKIIKTGCSELAEEVEKTGYKKLN